LKVKEEVKVGVDYLEVGKEVWDKFIEWFGPADFSI